MIKSALKKDSLRNITKSLGRFLSILAIVALGVAFFSGLKISPEVMKSTADKYYDDYNLMDVRIVSNLGLTEDDLKAISKVEGVEGTFGTYTIDALAVYGEKEVVLRVHGLNPDNSINGVNLIDGRFPDKAGECVIEVGKKDTITVPLGSTITLSSGKDNPLTDTLKNTEYKVVGYVQTPYYLSFEKGSSNIGNGQVRNFIMIPQENFKLEVFTEIFATVTGAKELNSYNDEYFDVVDKVTDRIENIAKDRESIRYNEIVEEARKDLEEGKTEYFKERDKALEELSKAEAQLEYASFIMPAEEVKLLEEEYKTAKAEAEKELEDAWKKIEDAEKEINEIEKGKWYVLDRNSHYSYVDYGGAADRIDALAKVFPLFFALVAALVCLTTMTRMVDEQRVYIGTLKALGYSNLAIASKYIFYAFMATLVGSIIGVLIGFTIFPIVIFNAYGIMYILPTVALKFNLTLASLVSLVAIGITTLTTLLACINELKEAPSSLMRPRAPKVGKRIFLERVPFIWNRLNFSGKVTTRNIFRYKRRFFMTVFGIAGCTALILAAFGIKDSIRTIVDEQFGTIFTYNMTVRLEPEGEEHIANDNRILDYELISNESGTVSLNNVEKTVSIIVPKDIQNVEKFIHLENRKNEEQIKIPKEGLIITEQISRNMGIKVGDEITLINSDDVKAKARVSGVTKNYLSNYAYLSPDYYNEIFGEDIEFNEAIGNIENTSRDFEDKLSKDLRDKEGISNVSFNTSIKENLEDTIKSLNYAVLVMIVSAGALAFVVLYNLTNVNISERIREIATIKVLGFYDNEVSEYIYRENTVLTIIGTGVGIVLGVFLHRYIMTTVEMENMMFGLTLNIKSYIISIILTLVFAVFVNFVMYYKLKNIEMVESLKSVD